jgi:hypothetical protein
LQSRIKENPTSESLSGFSICGLTGQSKVEGQQKAGISRLFLFGVARFEKVCIIDAIEDKNAKPK